MKWRVEEYENGCSTRSIRVVDESGQIIADNEPYYPQELDPKHAYLIAAAPEMRDVLREVCELAVDSEDVFISGDLFARICNVITDAGRVPS